MRLVDVRSSVSSARTVPSIWLLPSASVTDLLDCSVPVLPTARLAVVKPSAPSLPTRPPIVIALEFRPSVVPANTLPFKVSALAPSWVAPRRETIWPLLVIWVPPVAVRAVWAASVPALVTPCTAFSASALPVAILPSAAILIALPLLVRLALLNVSITLSTVTKADALKLMSPFASRLPAVMFVPPSVIAPPAVSTDALLIAPLASALIVPPVCTDEARATFIAPPLVVNAMPSLVVIAPPIRTLRLELIFAVRVASMTLPARKAISPPSDDRTADAPLTVPLTSSAPFVALMVTLLVEAMRPPTLSVELTMPSAAALSSVPLLPNDMAASDNMSPLDIRPLLVNAVAAEAVMALSAAINPRLMRSCRVVSVSAPNAEIVP